MAGSVWSVVLEGHPFDLADACDAFPRPGPLVVEVVTDLRDGPRTVLSSDEFANAADSAEVFRTGQRLLDRLNGALFVLRPTREPLGLPGTIVERRADGTVGVHAFLQVQGVVIRSRAGDVKLGYSAEPQDQQRELPQARWVRDSDSDDALTDVLSFLRGQPDWFDLYKAFETMRADVNRCTDRLPEAPAFRWPARPALNHFQMSAQVHRHSPSKWPNGMTVHDAMPLNDARRFIAALFLSWVEWRDG